MGLKINSYHVLALYVNLKIIRKSGDKSFTRYDNLNNLFNDNAAKIKLKCMLIDV